MPRLVMTSRRRNDEFAEFVTRRRSALLTSALRLTGGDRHQAEDVVQACLTQLYVAWPRIRHVDLDRYSRRALGNAFIDAYRKDRRRGEQPWAEVPDNADDSVGDGEIRMVLYAALRQLPAGMRAAVVLRHMEHLSTQETARALGCSTGNVKSQTARGLERLRQLIGDSAVSS